jgi:hypothetical protein
MTGNLWKYFWRIECTETQSLSHGRETVLGTVLGKAEKELLLVPQAQEISTNLCDIGYKRERLQILLQDILGIKVFVVDNRIECEILEPEWNGKV